MRSNTTPYQWLHSFPLKERCKFQNSEIDPQSTSTQFSSNTNLTRSAAWRRKSSSTWQNSLWLCLATKTTDSKTTHCWTSLSTCRFWRTSIRLRPSTTSTKLSSRVNSKMWLRTKTEEGMCPTTQQTPRLTPQKWSTIFLSDKLSFET